MNESSPCDSWKFYDKNKYNDSRSHFGYRKNHGIPKERLKPHHSLSPYKNDMHNKSQYSIRNKKYPRYPRGGKRMDLLRESYQNLYGTEDADSLPAPSTKSNSPVEAQNLPKETPVKSDPRVIILSNEIVQTNLLPNTGALALSKIPDDTNSQKMGTIERSASRPYNLTSQEVPSDNLLITPTECHAGTSKSTVTLIKNFSDPRLQTCSANKTLFTNSQPPAVLKTISSFESASFVHNPPLTSNPGPYPPTSVCLLNIPQEMKHATSFPNITFEYQPSSSHGTQSSIAQSKLRCFRRNIVTGKPPDIVITNNTIKSKVEETKANFYSEADIMKMPTIIMLPPESSQGVSVSQPDVKVNDINMCNNINSVVPSETSQLTSFTNNEGKKPKELPSNKRKPPAKNSKNNQCKEANLTPEVNHLTNSIQFVPLESFSNISLKLEPQKDNTFHYTLVKNKKIKNKPDEPSYIKQLPSLPSISENNPSSCIASESKIPTPSIIASSNEVKSNLDCIIQGKPFSASGDSHSINSYVSSEDDRFVIDEGRKTISLESIPNKTEIDLTYEMNSKKKLESDLQSEAALQGDSNSVIIDNKKKTPNLKTNKKISVSTPRRLSHVRVLEFNTPPKDNSGIEPRRANSSPKLSFRRRSNDASEFELRTQMKSVKSQLFPTIPEQLPIPKSANSIIDASAKIVEDCEAASTITVSGVWDKVQGMGQIIPSDDHPESTKQCSKTVSKSKKSSKNNRNSKKVSTNRKSATASKSTKSSSKSSKTNKTSEKKSDGSKNAKKKNHSKRDSPKNKISSKNENLHESVPKNIEEDVPKPVIVDGAAAAAEWERIRSMNKKSWDQEVRAMLSSAAAVSTTTHGTKSKQKNSKRSRSSDKKDEDVLSVSVEEDAKLLELALNKSTPGKTSKTSRAKKKVSKVDEESEDSITIIDLDSNNSFKELDSSASPSKDQPLSQNCSSGTDKKEESKNKVCSKLSSHVETSSIMFSTPLDAKIGNSSKQKKNSVSSKSSQANNSNENISVSSTKGDVNSMNINAPNKLLDKSKISRREPTSVMAGPCDLSFKNVLKSKENEVLEPPVPPVKITPDMPREHDFSYANAKCNLASLLDTPFKTDLLDLHFDTPKFISPGFYNCSLSSIKLLDMPTPNFDLYTESKNTPRDKNKDCTPGSYSSRPTDYSSGSSYYKPDEIEFNLETGKRSQTRPLSTVAEEETEDKSLTPNDNSLQMVLRPRRNQMNYYPSVINKNSSQQSVSKSNSLNKSTESDASKAKCASNSNVTNKVNKTSSESAPMDKNTIDNKSIETNAKSDSKEIKIEEDKPCKLSIDKNDSEVKIRPRSILPTLSSSDESGSSIEFDVAKRKKKKYSLISNTKLSESIKKIETKLSPSQISRNQLEEKRRRVLSKIKKISPRKKFNTPKTKIGLNSRKALRKFSKKVSSRSKIMRNLKHSPVKKETLLEKEKPIEVCNEKTGLKTTETPVIAPIKSRRKSSTPRKLSKISATSNCQTFSLSANELVSVSEEKKSEISDCSDLPKCENSFENKNYTVLNTVKLVERDQSNVKEIEAKIIEKTNASIKREQIINRLELFGSLSGESDNDKSNDSQKFKDVDLLVNEDDYVTLHLSSDEADTDSCNKSFDSSVKDTNDTYDISQIKEFINRTNVNKTPFQKNLEKEGFDEVSAKKIERDLTDISLSPEKLFASDKNTTSDKILNQEPHKVLEDCSSKGEETVNGNASTSQSQIVETQPTEEEKIVPDKLNVDIASDIKCENVVQQSDDDNKNIEDDLAMSPLSSSQINLKSPKLENSGHKFHYRPISSSSPYKNPHVSPVGNRNANSSPGEMKSSKRISIEVYKERIKIQDFEISETDSKNNSNHSSSDNLKSNIENIDNCTENIDNCPENIDNCLENIDNCSENIDNCENDNDHNNEDSKKLETNLQNETEKMKVAEDGDSPLKSTVPVKECQSPSVPKSESIISFKEDLDISNSSLDLFESNLPSSMERKEENNVTPENENISPAEIVIWTNSENDSSAKNYITATWVQSNKSKKRVKNTKTMDISCFQLSATVFNSVIEAEEVRVVRVTEHIELISMNPDKKLRMRILREESKKDADTKKTSKKPAKEEKEKKVSPLDMLYREMSSQEENLNSQLDKIYESDDDKLIERNKIDQEEAIKDKEVEIKSAVSSILLEEDPTAFFHTPIKYALEPQHSTEHVDAVCESLTKAIIEDKPSEKTDDEHTEDEEILKREMKDDLSNSTLVNEEPDVSISDIETYKEKRKRDDEESDDAENVNSKKMKINIPQTLLKQIDIESVLSKLHGPK